MTAAHYKGGHPPGNDLGLHYTALPPIVASCPYSDQLLVTRKFWSPGANRPSQANFVAGALLMFCVGLIMTGTSALLPTMLQNLMDYPALTTGLVTLPRGFGSMAAMFFIARVINRVDNRMIILFGFLLTALSMWQMTQFSPQMGMMPVIISGLLQGFGLGCTFVPL